VCKSFCVSLFLLIVYFNKQECPKKSGYLNDRIERYSSITKVIEINGDLFDEKSPLQLTRLEQFETYDALNGPLYSSFSAKNRSTLLLRLDALVSGGGASYDYDVISVEHVLPQNPSENSVWSNWFPERKDQHHWLHRLGNLALLTRRKNSAASNYEFAKKKEAYFSKGGVSPFALTTQVLNYSEWTPATLQARHDELIAVFEKHGRLEQRESLLMALGI